MNVKKTKSSKKIVLKITMSMTTPAHFAGQQIAVNDDLVNRLS